MKQPQLIILETENDIEKLCTRCNTSKSIAEFGKKSINKNGLQYHCKICERAKAKFFPSNSRENRRIVESRYKQKYPGRRNEIVRRSKLNNPETTKASQKKSMKKSLKNMNFYLGTLLRRRLGVALRNQQKSGSAVKDLGCSISDLIQYLESKFEVGMTWENRGIYGWHIDHIIPLSSFDLTKRDQFLLACHYTNLQPLWAKDNLQKGAKCA